AVVLAAVMNFVGAFVGTKVAETVGRGIIATPTGRHGLVLVLGALVGAIAWNVLTWFLGLPSSSSHALIGGLIGAALGANDDVRWGQVSKKVLIPLVASPAVGFVGAFAVVGLIVWIWGHRRMGPLTRGFQLAQTVSATAVALGHGVQDVQKTMG